MGILTDDMKAIIAQAKLCFAATVNADGTPNLSPKATLMVYDDDHLAFAHIASPNTVANLRRNPVVEINVVDIFRRRGYRFKGAAEMLSAGAPEYGFVAQKVWDKHGKALPVHEVVKIKVERALPLLSPAYTFAGAEEDSLRAAWLGEYGVQDAETPKAAE